MSYVVSFIDYVPTPRFDAHPWTQVKIEEAPTQDGPWSVLETQNLPSPDTDPAHPIARSFTTELATLPEGWYRVTFLDSTGDFREPTTPVQNVPEEELPYKPTVSDVGAQIVSRTRDSVGNVLGTFSALTTPTDTQVRVLIDQATNEITAGLDTDLPQGAWKSVRQAIAVLAAMKVELSFFSDQVNTNRSIYPQLSDQYKSLLPQVEKAVVREEEEERTGEFGMAVRPSYDFPDSGGWETRRM